MSDIKVCENCILVYGSTLDSCPHCGHPTLPEVVKPLIAAAPKMLKALEGIVENYKRVEGLGFEMIAFAAVKSAIKAAKGDG